VAHPQIAAFARLAKGGDAPLRVIAGQTTKLSRTMHDIRYDAIHDEIYVTNPFAQAVLVFRATATGDEPPLRVIQGPHTQMQTPDTLDIDPVHNEIFVPDWGGTIHVYRRDAQGDAAPLRTLRARGNRVAVDPIHDVLVSAGSPIVDGKRQPALFIYNRTDQGDAAPRAIISGPKTGIIGTSQFQVYPEGGWIVATQVTDNGEPEPPGIFVGVWSISDNGDVPPRWKIVNGIKKPRGVVINPKHKEIIVADMTLNSVLTYSLPEMFEPQKK
jgi:hypothetical protein